MGMKKTYQRFHKAREQVLRHLESNPEHRAQPQVWIARSSDLERKIEMQVDMQVVYLAGSHASRPQ